MASWNPFQTASSGRLEDIIPEACIKRIHYDNLLADIDGYLSDFSGLEEILQSVKTGYDTLEINPESGKGWFSDFFYEKEEINRSDVEGLINDMISAREEIKQQRAWLQEQRDYWAEQEEEAIRKLEEEWNELHNE